MNIYLLLVVSVLIILIFFNNRMKESYIDYINNMKNTDDELKIFCTELNKLNRVDNNILLLNKYNNRLREKKNKEIKYLKNEIDKLYLKKLNTEIDNNNKYRLDIDDKVNKQLKVVDLAKKNIFNENKIDISIN